MKYRIKTNKRQGNIEAVVFKIMIFLRRPAIGDLTLHYGSFLFTFEKRGNPASIEYTNILSTFQVYPIIGLEKGDSMRKTFHASSCLLLSILILPGICISSEPDFYPIGLNVERLKPVFEKMGFTFQPGEMVFGHEQAIALSKDGESMLQLIGPPNNLVTAKMMVLLKKSLAKAELTRRRNYLETLLRMAFPGWSGSNEWLADNATKLGRGGSRSTKIAENEVTVIARKKPMILAVTIGDWDEANAIQYNSESDQWATGERAIKKGTKPSPFCIGILILVALAFILGLIYAILDAKRKRKLVLDRFPFPPNRSLKVLEEQIPIVQRRQLPVVNLKTEDFETYTQEGLEYFVLKGKISFLNVSTIAANLSKIMDESVFMYLSHVIAHHNYQQLLAMKQYSESGTDISGLGTTETALTRLTSEFYQKGEIIELVINPAAFEKRRRKGKVDSEEGQLIFTDKKILFEPRSSIIGGQSELYYVTDYGDLKESKIEDNVDSYAFPSYTITLLSEKGKWIFFTGKGIKGGLVQRVRKVLNDKKGDSTLIAVNKKSLPSVEILRREDK